jgi:rod shape determining protein RodA
MMPTNRIFKKLKQLPFVLIGLIIAASLVGFIVLYSAADGSGIWAYKQAKVFLIFLPVSILIAIIDLRVIFKFAYIFYGAVLLLLIGVEFCGTSVMGAKRWIDLYFIKLQPSEPVKLAIVLLLARYFHGLKSEEIRSTCKILPAILLTLIPIILIIKQPDLGTGIIALIVAGSIFFASGVEVKKFIIAGGCCLAFLPIVWIKLHDYQKKRILMFLDPNQDPLGAGYNIIQSKIAIGSGGLLGKGFNQGTQSHLSFLPEHQTDFIFASLAEEFGLMGSLLVLLLYSLIIILSLAISINCKSVFGKLLGIGVTTIFTSHAIINIAMVAGIMPVVGVPLPFISYGGTMMGSMLIGFGLLMNTHIHKTERILGQF